MVDVLDAGHPAASARAARGYAKPDNAVIASPMLPTIGCRNPKYSDRAVVSLPSGSQKSPLS